MQEAAIPSRSVGMAAHNNVVGLVAQRYFVLLCTNLFYPGSGSPSIGVATATLPRVPTVSAVVCGFKVGIT
jgi:hypothetical protein